MPVQLSDLTIRLSGGGKLERPPLFGTCWGLINRGWNFSKGLLEGIGGSADWLWYCWIFDRLVPLGIDMKDPWKKIQHSKLSGKYL